MQRQSLFGRCLRAANVGIDEQDLIAAETGIECRELPPTTHEEARADDQHQRQRDLRGDQCLAHAEAAVANGDAPTLGLHRRLRIDTPRSPCRNEAEEQPGRRRHADREQ